jgi:uncharacterized lipoprotein YajG
MNTIRNPPTFLRPALLALLLLLSGCAVGRSTVEITPPSAINPTGGSYARIVSVEDLRKFEARPDDAGTPSLQNASEITDPSITARAVARKRGGFGAALGDILLPPGQSVAALVRAAARKALADKGYAVVDASSPHYIAAAPLNIDITQFWSWFSPGFASVRIDFKGTLTLHGAGLLGRDPTTVTSHVTHEGMAIFESDWRDLVQRGVEDLSQRIEERVKPAVVGR